MINWNNEKKYKNAFKLKHVKLYNADIQSMSKLCVKLGEHKRRNRACNSKSMYNIMSFPRSPFNSTVSESTPNNYAILSRLGICPRLNPFLRLKGSLAWGLKSQKVQLARYKLIIVFRWDDNFPHLLSNDVITSIWFLKLLLPTASFHQEIGNVSDWLHIVITCYWFVDPSYRHKKKKKKN